GYDISNDYDSVMQQFDDVIGLRRLKMMHVNDSKAPLGSHRDRHELIGEGAIGERAFRHIMNDPRLSGVSKVIETPKHEPDVTDRKMLDRLRSYME
ncbi:MAG TPA: TIM barrel protein, partial [Gemmatimonadaceae bacterium]|nr:TIM barrel protein [Gemmatimonadaceae bacterium]